MKDLTLIEQKLREYEWKTQRLKQLERKLNSLNTEGFESAVNAIKSKLKNPKKVEEIEGDINELKQRIKEKEQKRVDTEKKHREAKDLLKSAESAIEKAIDFGCNTSEAEELIENAERAIYISDYERAIRTVEEAGEVTKDLKSKSKPEITVELSKDEFQQGVWEDVSLKIANDGNAHAADIVIEFSEEVKVKGLEIIERLDVGDEIDLEASLKSIDAGQRVPLEINIQFNDLDGKRYENLESAYINVGKIKREVIEKEHEIPIEKLERALIIERAIYDPCKRDFIERRLPRMKEWIDHHDPGAYWFAVSIQNNAENAITEWGIALTMSAALKVIDARIEDRDRKPPHETHLNSFEISVPKQYGIVISKESSQRVYFKLRAEKPKTQYEINGVFKSAITGGVPIRAKEFKYLCDASMSPEAVGLELEKTISKRDAARLALAFKTLQELDRLCNQNAKTEEYQDKLFMVKNYTKGFSDKFTKQVDVFSRFMVEEQGEYLQDEYKGKVRRFCTNLIDVWISEFLK